MTAILHRRLSFFQVAAFFPYSFWIFISLFSLDFYFLFFCGLMFSLFSLNFYFPFLSGLLFPLYFSMDFYLIKVIFWFLPIFSFFLELWPLNQKLIKYGKHFFIATSHCTVSVCHSDLAIFAGFYLYDFKLVFLHQ